MAKTLNAETILASLSEQPIEALLAISKKVAELIANEEKAAAEKLELIRNGGKK